MKFMVTNPEIVERIAHKRKAAKPKKTKKPTTQKAPTSRKADGAIPDANDSDEGAQWLERKKARMANKGMM